MRARLLVSKEVFVEACLLASRAAIMRHPLALTAFLLSQKSSITRTTEPLDIHFFWILEK